MAFYEGCRILEPFANAIGLPLDQINFVACQMLALLLAVAYRNYIPARKSGAPLRHLVALVIGLSFGIFCFGRQIWHLFAQAGGCYILMKLAPAAAMHIWVFVFAMVYLSVMHIYRMIYDYGGYTLDVTGPLMISSQKLTALAFSLHDGLYKKEDKLSKDQQNHAVRSMPNPLTFLSYIFYFQGVLAGPLCFFNDYVAFVEGKNFPYDKPIIIEVNGQKQASPVGEPNPKVIVLKKLTASFVAMLVSLWLCPIWPKPMNADKKLIATTSFLYRITFLLVSVALSRARYYFAWKLGEAINNASGLGFNGWDSNGRAKWDLVINVKIRKLETSTGLKGLIDNWNIQTALWLRRLVYERAPHKHRMVLTYVLSAIWHGFYPGYYISFLCATFTTNAAKSWRKLVRPHILAGPRWMHVAYDVFTWFFAQLALAYLIVPFTVLQFWPTIYFYHYSMYWFLHVGTFLILIFLPMLVKPLRDPNAKTPSIASVKSPEEQQEEEEEEKDPMLGTVVQKVIDPDSLTSSAASLLSSSDTSRTESDDASNHVIHRQVPPTVTPNPEEENHNRESEEDNESKKEL